MQSQSQIQRIEDTIRQVQTSTGEERDAWARLFAAQMDVFLETQRADVAARGSGGGSPARPWAGPLRAAHAAGLTHVEIAGRMGKSYGWVKTRLHYLSREEVAAGRPPLRANRKGGAK